MAPGPFEAFRESLRSYFNQDTLSDLSVTCNNKIFKAHRLILCTHSKYFVTQLCGPWKESSEQVINIEDFDVEVVEAMLQFMYNFDYTSVNGASSMAFEAQVYQIADKYDIDSLKEHAKENFSTAVDIGWSMDDFPLAITLAYTTTPPGDRGLRDVVIQASHLHIDDLLSKEYFAEVLRNTTGFAADLVPFLRTNDRTCITRRYRCPSCQGTFSCDLLSRHWHCPCCASRRKDWARFRQ